MIWSYNVKPSVMLPYALILTNHDVSARHSKLIQLVASCANCPAEKLSLNHNINGAPFITGCKNLYVSLSSRDDLALVALADQPLGIDVEKVDAQNEIPWNVLHPQECAFLKDCEATKIHQYFAQMWVIKEAYLKLEGYGLLKNPQSFCVTYDDKSWKVKDHDLTIAVKTISLNRHTYQCALITRKMD